MMILFLGKTKTGISNLFIKRNYYFDISPDVHIYIFLHSLIMLGTFHSFIHSFFFHSFIRQVSTKIHHHGLNLRSLIWLQRMQRMCKLTEVIWENTCISAYIWWQETWLPVSSPWSSHCALKCPLLGHLLGPCDKSELWTNHIMVLLTQSFNSSRLKRGKEMIKVKKQTNKKTSKIISYIIYIYIVTYSLSRDISGCHYYHIENGQWMLIYRIIWTKIWMGRMRSF